MEEIHVGEDIASAGDVGRICHYCHTGIGFYERIERLTNARIAHKECHDEAELEAEKAEEAKDEAFNSSRGVGI